MKKTKKVLKWIGNIIFVLLLVICVLSIFSSIQSRKNPGQVPSVAGIKSLTVLTGSMRPAIDPGDMIVIKSVKPENIKIDDVVTYRTSSNILITHRVIEIKDENGKAMFRTKGDANNVEDEKLVSESNIIGKKAFIIPYGGYVAQFMRSKYGIILIVVIIVLFVVLDSKKESDKSKKIKNKQEA
jgi:signal peptidase I